MRFVNIDKAFCADSFKIGGADRVIQFFHRVKFCGGYQYGYFSEVTELADDEEELVAHFCGQGDFPYLYASAPAGYVFG